MGPLILDIDGFELTQEDKEIIAHPTVGGIIFFSRNFHDKEQLAHLTKQIRSQANKHNKELLICVDQEGGRVQRFKDGFTLIPPAASYENYTQQLISKDPNKKTEHKTEGLQLAQYAGWLISIELLALNIDFSIAPVLDLGFKSKAIGTRSFSENMAELIDYSLAFISGMKEAGMATTGKHFPGHGGVIEDSHHEVPYDHRDNIEESDLFIFKTMIQTQQLDAILPAHVIYPHYDNKPAVASSYWLKDVLRKQLNFSGVIFSDDLNMHAADILGSYPDRCQDALNAGCDSVLLCNNRKGVIETLDQLPIFKNPKLISMRHRTKFNDQELRNSALWKQRSDAIQRCFFES